jgi:hypothetical protein
MQHHPESSNSLCLVGRRVADVIDARSKITTRRFVSNAIRITPIRYGVRKPRAHTEHALLFASSSKPPLADWLPPLKNSCDFPAAER